MRTLWLAIVWVLGFLGGGAAHAARGGEVVKKVGFDVDGRAFGVRYGMRQAMEQGQNPAFVWLAPRRRQVLLEADVLRLDAYRIETWLAHHGYFDARFLGWDVVTVRESRRRRPPVVRLVGRVELGPASRLRDLSWEGMDVIGAPLLSLLERNAEVQPGDVFVLDAVREAEARTLDELGERSFARAQVETDVSARPSEQTVDVRFVGQPGPACVFGEVTISGKTRIPERFIRDEVAVVAGKPYKNSALRATQRNLFGLGVFSVVNVSPDLDGGEESVIPVRIEVAQSKFRQLKLGGGVLVESGKQDVHVSAEFRHVNMFNRLVRGTVSTRLGYTTLGQLSDIGEEGLIEEVTTTAGPTAMGGVEVEVPRFPAHKLRSQVGVSAELGVEEGYRYWTPELSPGVTWRLDKVVTFGFSYHLRYFDYLQLTLDEKDLRRTRLGLDFTDPYTLSFMRQKMVLDRRDDVLFTRRGTYGLFQVSEAGGPFGGQFNFVRLDGDQRGYLPLRNIFRSRGTIAGRLAGGLILPYGSDPERARVPYAERLYLGGGTSARGWVRNHLGPYICDPDQPIDCVGQPGVAQPTDEILPLGGTVSALSGLEFRTYAPRDWGIAVFSDVGMAWDTLQAVDWAELQPTAGAGIRYKSPIGPVRFDVAARLLDEPMYAQEPRFTVHFSLAEAY